MGNYRRNQYSARRRQVQKRHRITIIMCIVLAIIAITGSVYLGLQTSKKLQKQQKTQTTSSLAAKESKPVKKAESQTVPKKDESKKPKDKKDSSSTVASKVSSSSIPAGKPGTYEVKYPELYVKNKPPIIPHKTGDKVVYLTFDDGPSTLTEPLLDVLDKEGVKATFFVMAQGKTEANFKKWTKETKDRGHVVALHTYSHDYHEVYASVDAFLTDFQKIDDMILDATGKRATMFRFPGGSVNGYNRKTRKAIIAEMTRRGYTYYDWNVDDGDCERGSNRNTIYKRTINQCDGQDKCIVLMHNTAAKGETLAAVPKIIEQLKKMGYRFDVLSPSVKPTNFHIPK